MTGVEQNIPFYWTALAHWMAGLLYVTLLPRRLEGWRFWTVSAVQLALQMGYMALIVDLNGMAFNLGMMGMAALTALPFAVLNQTWWEKRIYYCARAFILGAFMCSLGWQLYAYFADGFPTLDSLAWEAAFMLPVCAVVIALMCCLEGSHREVDREMEVTPTACGIAVLIALFIYIFSSLSFSSTETPFSGATYAEAFNIRTIVYLGGVAILYGLHLQLCDAHARTEVTALQNMLDMQYANYRLSQESVDLVNQKYHDLKHQIAILRAEVGTGQKLEYLDQMEQEIKAYEAQNKTGNEVLDTILTGKSVYCQNHGIELTCVADGKALDFMDVMDLSALFGNALDNAIESVSKLSDPEQRLIHLSVAVQKGFLRIRVENRCDEGYTVKKGLPLTTKKDTRLHGYGLKSICRTAEKYGGSATVSASGGWFELRILIPLKEEKTNNKE
ncbi:MAG: ATP-binding protein [Clostridiales bacterium]|nr:ATP-binding protein [Clostridiales bacterium]